jgi:uncharacterized protein YaeQ
MALKATIFKADLNIADMDREYYGDHALTIARHPSETDERMMVRVFAFARHAHERLQFTKGLSADDEPDLWQKSLSDEIELWIDVGQPDEKRIRKGCNRSQRVALYVYGGRGADLWWQQNQSKLERFDNLSVFNLPKPETDALAQLAERSMRLQCTLQDNQIWINDGTETVQINPVIWQSPDA